MTIVLDEPTLWPLISFGRLSSYFVAASSTAVIYDWALTFGQEFEFILRQRWTFMTLLYVFVRYFGILVSVMNLLLNLPVPITDVVRTILWYIQAWTPIIVNAVLGVIMVTRMNAMYQGSKKLLIFLVVVLLASMIVSGVMGVIANLGVSAQEAVVSGYPTCFTEINTVMIDLTYESMISTAVWEILAFFLAVWIVIKHFYELRRRHSGATIEGYFTVLIESHAFYFLA
ncbi:hypothetical protein CY34DRAFT_254205 [Suillus luteus UH-Slu-Lm8-n1]|uniref:DUF6533 domain-containing protein n=1 Tax=Suillus luteus UH-Slu-Lm8-n1 TaxID=930992 RepID=A0A0D0ARK3_9AGAM|nr:hypothetical protein CY34DRAFT_254205 [Suillus luteus UH-Slu-Lm8-n1]